jgi:hypothetical protein
MLDDAADVVGHQLLGADQHVNRQAPHRLEQRLLMGDVAARPDPGDLGRGIEQGVGDLTGDHVDFVVVGQRDQHVGVGCTRLFQHAGMRGVTADGAEIQPILQGLQAFSVSIDHGHIVGFARQDMRDRTPTCPAPRMTIFMAGPHSSSAFLGSMPRARSLR